MSQPSEFDWEPTPGLPGPLPTGEHIIWQGSPNWFALAVDAFHARKVAIYFLALVLFDVYTLTRQGIDKEALLAGPGLTLVLSLAALGILLALAWLMATATIYTLTSKRLLIRFGIAIQLTINLPFTQIVAARLRLTRNGIGNIPLELTPSKRVSYLVLWPHIRRWQFARPQPMLRCIPDAANVAQLIARATAEELGNKVELGQPSRATNAPQTETVMSAPRIIEQPAKAMVSSEVVSPLYTHRKRVELSS